MTAEAAQQTDAARDDLARNPAQVIAEFLAVLDGGAPWFSALLAAIRRWRAPHEVANGRHYYYLIGGEAFDWLLLAERLLIAAGERIPAAQSEPLLFRGALPEGFDSEALKQAIGATKFRAWLNFLYGITVEEALQLSIEEDIHKEVRCRAWGLDPRYDETAYERIYLKRREQLLTAFRTERGLPDGEAITFSELREFTYWLFKYRLKACDPAKVAADTRRGLSQLARLDALRTPFASAAPAEVPQDFIDILL